jgi:phage repressor protein C with HTH and peptisase S24 domain
MWETSHMESEQKSPLQIFVSEALALLPEARDHYDRKIQEMTGTKGKPIYDIWRGKSLSPERSTLKNVALVLEQPLDLLIRAADGEVVKPLKRVERHAGFPRAVEAANDNVVEIIRLDLSLSMGPGATVDDYIEEIPVKFDIDYIRSFTRAPFERLRIARGVGDSMYPTLLTSDEVWIDTTQRIVNQQDRVWACSIYGAAAIKRLRTIGHGRVLVISDNPTVENQEVDAEDIMIAGRVLRLSRDI